MFWSSRQAPFRPPSARDRSRRVYAFLAILALLGVAGLMVARPLYRKLKNRRAHDLVQVARGYEGRGDWEQVGQLAKTAFGLAPNDPQVLRLCAEYLTRYKSAEALLYWQLLEDSGEATRADRLAFGRFALQFGRAGQAFELAGKILAVATNDAPGLMLRAMAGRQERRMTEAVGAARRLVEVGQDPDDAALLLSGLLLERGRPDDVREGEKLLWGLALRAGPLQAGAIEILARRPALRRDELRLLRRTAEAVRTNRLELRLTSLELEQRLNPQLTPEQVGRQALALRTPELAAKDRARLAGWLLQRRQPGLVLELVPDAEARRDFDLIQSRLQALSNLGRWEEVQALVADETVLIPGMVRDLYRATLAQRTGRQEEVLTFLKGAAGQVTRNPDAQLLVATYAESLGEPGYAAELLGQVMGHAAFVRRVSPALLRLVPQVDDELPLLAALKRLLEFNPGDLLLRNELAWLNLTSGRDLDEARATAEELVRQRPQDLRYLATLGLAQVRQNQADAALTTLEAPLWSATNAPQRAHFAYLAALGAAGQRTEARRYATNLLVARLRTSERRLVAPWLPPADRPAGATGAAPAAPPGP